MSFSDHQDAAFSQYGFRIVFRIYGYAVVIFLFLAVASYSSAFGYVQIGIYVKIGFYQLLIMSGHRSVVRGYGDPELAETDYAYRSCSPDVCGDLRKHTALLFRLYPR